MRSSDALPLGSPLPWIVTVAELLPASKVTLAPLPLAE